MPRPKLTETQEEVLLLIGDGLTRDEIGVARGTSTSAVDSTIGYLKRAFGVRRKSELIMRSHKYFSHSR